MTFPYKPGAPPRSATPDQLSEYLNRELSQIADALEQIHDVDKLYGTPPRPFDGMLRYADGVTWDPDAEHGEGFYGYWAGEWHYLACCDEGGVGEAGCCYTNSTYEEPTQIAVNDADDEYTERPDWVYVPYSTLTDGCSALVTASLSIEMWPSTPACPPTTVWAELWVRYPNDDEEKISARHYLRAPTYTPEACGEDPEVTYPMIMNITLTGRHLGGEYDSGRYDYFWRVCYLATGLDAELYPKVWWDMHVGVFPCTGYTPT